MLSLHALLEEQKEQGMSLTQLHRLAAEVRRRDFEQKYEFTLLDLWLLMVIWGI